MRIERERSAPPLPGKREAVAPATTAPSGFAPGAASAAARAGSVAAPLDRLR
jgi:hypothetical protein